MDEPTSFDALVQRTDCLRPFIPPTDISIYDAIFPASPHPKIAIIASLMNELYTLFIEMGYLPPTSVFFAPHTSCPISLKHAALFGLEKQVVDLLQLLPYYDGTGPNWNFGSDQGEFLYGGEFDHDLRGEVNEVIWWRKLGDPCYYSDIGYKGARAIGWNLQCEDVGEEGGEMEEEPTEEEQGWLMIDEPEDDDPEDADWEETTDGEEATDDEEMTEASFSDSDEEPIQAEELLALQQDTLLANVAMMQQKAAEAKAIEEEWVHREAIMNDPRDERLLLYMRPWHVTLNSIGNHGTIFFLNTHNFTISQTCFGNVCDFRHNAIPYLRNIIDNFQTLKWIPGGLYDSRYDLERYSVYQNLYLEAGWPNSFDRKRFEASRKNYEAELLRRNIGQQPLRNLSEHVSKMRSRELSKLRYLNALEKLASLSPNADEDERKNLEQGIDSFGREFLPAHFEPVNTEVLERYKDKLNDMLEKGQMGSQVENQREIIAEMELEMQATSFEQRDWLLYGLRRKQALGVDAKMKVGFKWKYTWRGTAIDLVTTELTPEIVKEMAREERDKESS
ncbi:hypothetical protein QM012_003167 [Aureobasidium pullulans]|uniref:Knr4/Smi1-like domain-containing protein n=1 Tax=Aureobasidium pullulans TaxID=5580 RepID=A0ABR0T9G2_AURPU